MIHEYALEPELVSTWGTLSNYRLYYSAFGLGQGRVVSRYPENWAEIVKNLSLNRKDLERTRLVELLRQIKEKMVERKNYCWDDAKQNWLENVLKEHSRHQFFAIMARKNPEEHPAIFTESDLAGDSREKWDIPHGRVIPRKSQDMSAAVEMMLSRCCWVKFIDPYILSDRPNCWQSLENFMGILGNDRPIGPPEQIEIHSLFNERDATMEYLGKKVEKLTPNGLPVTIFRWKERPDGQRFHNRYILTDLGGVSFHHGLDIGTDGETDDITLLDREQYGFHCDQYCIKSSAFDLAESPIQVIGTRRRE